MSAGFSKVYEQWLKESGKGDVSEDDGSYEDPDGLSELMDSDSSTDHEEGGEPPTAKSGSRRPSDAAPMLMDDEDEMFAGEKYQFDEPPILEPVSRTTHSHKQDLSKQLEKKQRNPPCSGINVNNNRTSFIQSKNNNKTYKKPIDFKSLKYSDNLFDKFNTGFSREEDNPPPLIPSPEALRLHSESPEREEQPEKKPQSCSPDFRAMEADSTSEVLGDPGSAPKLKSPSAGDMECDSTCMLGGSPMLVSPTNCISEPDIRDPDGGGLDTDVGSPAEQSRATTYNGESMRPSPDLICEQSWCQQEPLRKSKISTLSILGLCPGRRVRNTSDNLSNSSRKHRDSLESQPSVSAQLHPNVGVSDGPPVLCDIRAPVNSKGAKKRHSTEVPLKHSKAIKIPFSASLKQHEDYFKVDCSAPPILPLMSDEVISPIVIRQSNHVLPTKSKSRSKNLREHSHAKAAKIPLSHRSKTFPILEMEHYGNGLPDPLQQFVIATWQLSTLQTSVHNLVQTLFPSFREELSTMTPESQAFQQFLEDLFESMQQEDPLQTDIHVSLTTRIKCNQNTTTSCPTSIDPASKKTLSDSLPRATSKLESPATAPPSPDDSLTISSLRRSTRQSMLKDPLTSGMIHQLCSLELDSRSLHVQLSRTSPTHLQEFSVFCCQLLQLLLPNLSISLSNKLAGDTGGLVNFLDNVLVSNQRKKRRRKTLA